MVNLGVLGCGDVAVRTYVPGMLKIRDKATIVAVCDPVQARAGQVAALIGPETATYATLDEMLTHPGLDAVVNLTPAPFHNDTNTKILQAGKHLLSEKPIAGTVAEGQALIELAKQQGKLLLVAPAVAATNRFRWLRGLIDGGALGKPTVGTSQYANLGPAGWRDYKGDPAVFYSKHVGPVLDLGVYVLHGLTALLGPAKRVQAFGGITIPERQVLIPSRLGETITVETPDVVLIQLDYGDQVYSNTLASFAVPRSKAPMFEVHGSGGSLSIAQDIWYDTNAPIDLVRLSADPDVASDWEKAAPEDSTDLTLIQVGPSHLVDCINGATPILTAEHANHILEIILGAQTSIAEGRALDLSTTFARPVI